MPEPLPKTYSPAATEPLITLRWDAADDRSAGSGGGGAFHAEPGPVLSGERKPYCIFIPPPNVTAALHLGHALNNTLQDILVRAHRMMGFETLWMPGTDHAGIATQAVVEKRLRQEGTLKGPLKQSMTREAFVTQVQAFKDEYEATITHQLKVMGCSCDWARQRFTMDPQCAAAVREAFFRLFKDGLIYRGKRLVNWDPVLQTAVADDETEDVEIDGHFYYLRYPLVHPVKGAAKAVQPVTWSELATRGYPGASEHPAEEQAWVTVATTRPETYLGDTAIGVNPHDPRAKSLRGLLVELPLVGRILPIIEDDYVVLPAAMQKDPDAAASDPKAQFATGFLKVTPAHDPNDYDLYMRHKAVMDTHAPGGSALINIFAPDATVSDKHGWPDAAGAHPFLGLSREEARKKVVAEFYARGLLEETKPYKHTVKHSDRSKAVIEPYLSDQWYVKVTDDRMRGAALRAMAPDQRTSSLDASMPHASMPSRSSTSSTPPSAPGDGELRFYPARYAKTFENWHENIRDWCISRQLWWGHRIPVWRFSFFESATTSEEGVAGARQRCARLLIDLCAAARLDDELCLQFDGSESDRAYLCARTVRAARIVDLLKALFSQEPEEAETEFRELGLSRDALRAASELSYFMDANLTQDPDVLDTWFSSALWPLSTLGWPDPDKFPDTKGLLEAFNPSSVLCTAREIITLWVSRMTMFNRYFLPACHSVASDTSPSVPSDTSPSVAPSLRRSVASEGRGTGPLPFNDVFIHAMIQDGEGRKMSKSLGNGVDPRDIIESHGADAMRFVLCQMTTQTQDVRMPVVADPTTGKNTSPKFDIGRNFCNKLWNATRFALSMLPTGSSPAPSAAVGPRSFSLADRWMLSRLTTAVADINTALKNYQFSDYAQSLYDLLWRDFCDWYLEAIKPTIKESPAQQAVLAHALETIVRLLHPIAPFITEAIWEHLKEIQTAPINGITLPPSRRGGLLCTAGWPEIAPTLRDERAEKDFERTRALVTAIREIRAKHNLPPKRRITLHSPAPLIKDLESIGARAYVESLGTLDAITTDPAPKDAAATLRFESAELTLSNLADAATDGGAADTGAERDRLTKQATDLQKSIAALEGRLNNPGYLAKAPPKLVEETKAQLEKARTDLAAVQARLRQL